MPTAVTMNHAHSTHWTPVPDPRIPHVLRGWGDSDGPARHWIELGEDVLIRNVTTDIRSSFAGSEPDGNSIFIFEVAGLCIGHLGHLHHEPTEDQYAAIGRLDVVMAPVDGGMTLPTVEMTRVLKRLRSSLVLPMHWFGRATLQSFVRGMADEFEIEVDEDSTMTVSLRELPRQPTIRILQPGDLQRQRLLRRTGRRIMALTGMTEAHRAALAARLPEGVVSEVPEAYRVEPRGRFTGTAHSLARPRSVEEVSAILEFASEAGIGVVPYGGRARGWSAGRRRRGCPACCCRWSG